MRFASAALVLGLLGAGPAFGQTETGSAYQACPLVFDADHQAMNKLIAGSVGQQTPGVAGHTLATITAISNTGNMTDFDSCVTGSHSGYGTCYNQISTVTGSSSTAQVQGFHLGIMSGSYGFDSHQWYDTNMYKSEYATQGQYVVCIPPGGSGDTCPVGTVGCGLSPIVIPLHRGVNKIGGNNGNQVKLTDVEHGVWFDLNGDGIAEHVSWTEADSDAAFLAVDRDGDGAITSGKELLGNATEEHLRSGFMVLQLWKPNALRMTVDDPVFARLLLWEDSNHDGISQPWELQPASNVLYGIALGSELLGKKDQYGNSYERQGTAFYKDKPDDPRRIYDVVFMAGP